VKIPKKIPNPFRKLKEILSWFRKLKQKLFWAFLVPVALLGVVAIISLASQISTTAAGVTAAFLFLVALLGMFYYQGRILGRLESGKPREVIEIKRALEAAERKNVELQADLEKERARRQEIALRLERERERFLSITNFQPILDIGVLEVTFKITEAYDLLYGYNKYYYWPLSAGGARYNNENDLEGEENEEEEGEESDERDAEYLADHFEWELVRFLGALTTTFTGRFGFDLRKVQGEFDEKSGVVRFLMPPLEFLGTKSFPASEWVFSYVLRRGGFFRDRWFLNTEGEYAQFEKETRARLQAEFHERLRKGPPVPDLSKSLEQLGTKIVQALVIGTTGFKSTVTDSLSGPGKPLLQLIRDLVSKDLSLQSRDISNLLPDVKMSDSRSGARAG